MTANDLKEYRHLLITTFQKSEDKYDTAVLTLSGGALGISIVFLRDIIGSEIICHPIFITLSWIFWGISIAVILASYLTSSYSMKKAIEQVDLGKINEEYAGGNWAKTTQVLNIIGGIFFFLGIILFSIFAFINMR